MARAAPMCGMCKRRCTKKCAAKKCCTAEKKKGKKGKKE